MAVKFYVIQFMYVVVIATC